MKLKELYEGMSHRSKIATGIAYLESTDNLVVTDPGAGSLPAKDHISVNEDGKLVVDPGARALVIIVKLNTSENIIKEKIRGDDWIIGDKGTVGMSFYSGTNMDESWLPNVKELCFGDCDFTSLKLDPHKFSKLTHLRLINGTTVKGGLMSLFTLPKFQDISANRFLQDENLFKAIQIINHHLKDKNAAECIDELMEAGLKEYARR